MPITICDCKCDGSALWAHRGGYCHITEICVLSMSGKLSRRQTKTMPFGRKAITKICGLLGKARGRVHRCEKIDSRRMVIY
jgi:hypothetical protein